MCIHAINALYIKLDRYIIQIDILTLKKIVNHTLQYIQCLCLKQLDLHRFTTQQPKNTRQFLNSHSHSFSYPIKKFSKIHYLQNLLSLP